MTHFAATSLFDISFSKSLKALDFSAKNLFISFRLTGVIFRKKTSDEYYLCYFVYNKSNKTLELSNFRIMTEMYHKNSR